MRTLGRKSQSGRCFTSAEWYWVSDGVDVWPARRDPGSAGGWTNDDTWEDFEGKVISWIAIPSPTEIVGKHACDDG